MNLNITPATSLAEWPIKWIKQILGQDLTEGYLHNFKKEISSKDQALSGAVTSFANTADGLILYGIKLFCTTKVYR